MRTLALVIGCLVLTGCISKWIHNSIQDDGQQLPPEIGSTPDTLLAVLHDAKGYDNALADHLAEHYHGPYKVVTSKDLSGRYADVDTYRYVFDSDAGSSSSGSGAASYWFYVWDRKANKMHKAAITSGMYGVLMEAYLQKLEIKRKANAGQ
jgi:hypothetical protein